MRDLLYHLINVMSNEISPLVLPALAAVLSTSLLVSQHKVEPEIFVIQAF